MSSNLQYNYVNRLLSQWHPTFVNITHHSKPNSILMRCPVIHAAFHYDFFIVLLMMLCIIYLYESITDVILWLIVEINYIRRFTQTSKRLLIADILRICKRKRNFLLRCLMLSSIFHAWGWDKRVWHNECRYSGP